MKITNPNIENREVYCMDALKYLRSVSDSSLPSIITSLPDAEEVGKDFDDWEAWFVHACLMIFKKVRPDQYVFFYQTDRKRKGGLIDKSYLVNKAAEQSNIRCLFHKIVLKKPVGSADLYRPTFTHLLCFSHTLNGGKATPDVIECGEMLYKNAMGFGACKVCLDLIGPKTDTIFDPFCGMGSVLKMSNKMGYKSVGVDILIDQCHHSLDLPLTEFSL